MEVTLNEYKNNYYKEVTKKLEIQDYSFEINGKDIGKSQITYRFDHYKSILYRDGKKVRIDQKPLIDIELSGLNSNNKKAWMNISLDADLDSLNKYPSKPTDITNIVISGESFLKHPEDETIGILNLEQPSNNINDMYVNLPSLWIYKLDNNIFIFKVVIPNSVFAFFKVDFND